jgi:4-hydroxy-3-polyprenylbenzoate decarboxylase
MPYESLADFLEELDACGQLARVETEVDSELEIAEITRRVAAAQGPAILFEHVQGRSTAVVTNLLGTEDRVRRALSIDSLDEIMTRTECLVQQHTPQNWFERLRTSADEAGAARFRPKLAKHGKCQQVVRLGRDVDLRQLAAIRQWSDESGASITAGRMISSAGGSEPPGVTLGPLVVLDQSRLAVADHGGSRFAQHWAAHRAAGEKMPVAIVLGGDPAAIVTASLDLPPDIETDHMTGLLRGQAVDRVPCRTHALAVPADADLVIEGFLDPHAETVETAVAGPGGSHLVVVPRAAVIQVAAVTHRTHSILPAIVDGGVRGEMAALAKVRERMLLAAMSTIAPALCDLRLPAYGGADRFAFVSIRKTAPHEARQVACALWGSAALGSSMILIVVDEGVDVYDTAAVLSEIGANVVPDRDVFMIDGPPCSWSENASDHGLARRLGIDATRKIRGERSQGGPRRLDRSQEIVQKVATRWAEYQIELGELAGAVKAASSAR